jgi:hypothetical protein
MPGIRRSCRAPSSTTRIFGPRSLLATGSAEDPGPPPKPPPSCPAGTRASRAVTSATSSVTRLAAESGSAPTSATQSSLPRGAQCGSQRTQFQCGPTAGSEASTTMDRSRGLCRTAAWATIQRARARDASTGPARPTTPSLASDIETGTQNDVGTAGGLAPFSAGSSWTIAGPSNRPTRIRSVSGSSARRSHSRRRGPVAVSRTCAGSMASSRRFFSSAVLACSSLVSTSAICAA